MINDHYFVSDVLRIKYIYERLQSHTPMYYHAILEDTIWECLEFLYIALLSIFRKIPISGLHINIHLYRMIVRL